MNTFSALSDGTRRRIIENLACGPMSSGDIARQFDITPPAISQHLKTLRQAKLVKVRVEAQRRIYELDRDGISELEGWIAEVKAFWGSRFDALEAELGKQTKT